MTRDQAIKHLKLMQSGARNAIRYKKNDKEISEKERKEDIEIYQDQLEALKIATKALEQESKQDNKEIFEQFKKKVFLESEDVLGNDMVECYMITDYLAELLGVQND